MADIGRNIRAIREKSKITQDELAEKLFVSRQTVSNYETGKSKPDIDMLMRISEVMDVDIHYLLYGTRDDQLRRNNMRGFIKSCIILAVVALIYAAAYRLDEYVRLRYYVVTLTIFLKLILRPCLFFMIGWSAVQAVSLLPKVKIPKINTKYVRIIVIAVIVIYLLLILPYCIGGVYVEWQSWQMRMSGALDIISNSIHIPLVTEFAFLVLMLDDTFNVIFVVLGAILWLSSDKKDDSGTK